MERCILLNNINSSQGKCQVSITTSDEADQIIYLLKDVAHWLKENEIGQWGFLAEGGDDEEIKQAIQNQETYSVKRGGEIVATYTLYKEQTGWDRHLWGDLKDEAIYLHRLALTRSEIGSGLGKGLMRWIEKYTKGEGIHTLRLDCVENNTKLNSFYENSGFEKQGANHAFSLYQKDL